MCSKQQISISESGSKVQPDQHHYKLMFTQFIHLLSYVFGGSPDDYVLISVLTGASYHIAEVAGIGLALVWWKQVIFRFSYKKERTCHSESFL